MRATKKHIATTSRAQHESNRIAMYICTMELNDERRRLIADYLSTRPVLRAYLFGSFARGEADASSDIDLLVDLDHSQRIGLQFIQMRLDLEKLLNAKVDLVSSTGLSKYVKPLVDREKQLIYAR